MRRVGLTVASVAGYSLLETVLLLSYLSPEPRIGLVSYHSFLNLTQLFLIPGAAVLFSLLMHGRRGWVRRALIIMIVGTVGVPVAVALALVPVALLAWAADTSTGLFLILLPLVLGLSVWTLLFAVRKTGRWGDQNEVLNWLSQREPNANIHERELSARAIGWSLWIPSIVVLLTFIALPQFWSVLSKLQEPQAGQLGTYRVSIPATWIVLLRDVDPSSRRSWIGGIAARDGISLLRGPHVGQELPLSSWSIEISNVTNADQRNISDGQVITRKVFAVGGTMLTCLDYRPSHYGWWEPDAGEYPTTYIECSGSDRLRASFVGDKDFIPSFYKMLSAITETK